MTGMRIDKFTSTPDQVTLVADPTQLEDDYRQAGFIPMSPDERRWVNEQWAQRAGVEENLSTGHLRAEYAHLKAMSKI